MWRGDARVELRIDPKQIRELSRAIEGTTRKLQNEIKIAVNATAGKTKTAMSRRVRAELAAPAKSVNATLSVKKAKTPRDNARVTLKKEARLPLKAFKPNQTKKGVSYRISKSQGRKTIAGAFMGPRPGTKAPGLHGHVWKREDKSRLPIRKLYGVSPWGVFIKRAMKQPTKNEGRLELKKQIARRIRFITLKKRGAIK